MRLRAEYPVDGILYAVEVEAPELEGTERQIKWAEDLRRGTLRRWLDLCVRSKSARAQAFDGSVPRKEIVDEITARVASRTHAKQWIEGRNDPLYTVIKTSTAIDFDGQFPPPVLPMILGTGKQLQWAEEERARIIADLRRYAAAEFSAPRTDRGEERFETTLRALRYACEITSASHWLNLRHQGTVYLIRLLGTDEGQETMIAEGWI